MQSKIRNILLILILISSVSIFGCSSSQNRLIGKWEGTMYANGQVLFTYQITFTNEGRYIKEINNILVDTGTYTVISKDYIEFVNQNGIKSVVKYELNGNQLSIVFSEQVSQGYRRIS